MTDITTVDVNDYKEAYLFLPRRVRPCTDTSTDVFRKYMHELISLDYDSTQDYCYAYDGDIGFGDLNTLFNTVVCSYASSSRYKDCDIYTARLYKIHIPDQYMKRPQGVGSSDSRLRDYRSSVLRAMSKDIGHSILSICNNNRTRLIFRRLDFLYAGRKHNTLYAYVPDFSKFKYVGAMIRGNYYKDANNFMEVVSRVPAAHLYVNEVLSTLDASRLLTAYDGDKVWRGLVYNCTGKAELNLRTNEYFSKTYDDVIKSAQAAIIDKLKEVLKPFNGLITTNDCNIKEIREHIRRSLERLPVYISLEGMINKTMDKEKGGEHLE